MIKTIMDMMPAIEKLRNEGIIRGQNTGFKNLDSLYSIKLGTFTIVYSEPTHGKSEFIFEMVLNQAKKYGQRSLICSPETGSAEEVVSELVHKYSGKQMLKNSNFALADKEFYDVIAWLTEYFVFVDTDERAYSIENLFDYSKKWEKENKKKINIIVGEPYNELDHDMSKFGSRQDLYIENLMSYLRRSCKKENKHFFLSIHPASSIPVTKDNITYYPKPLPRQAAGGQALFRKAMTWITLWRPPANLVGETGSQYQSHEVQVFIDKAKPKGVANKGMCTLFFDWKRNRYYEVDVPFDYYAFEHENGFKVLETDLF